MVKTLTNLRVDVDPNKEVFIVYLFFGITMFKRMDKKTKRAGVAIICLVITAIVLLWVHSVIVVENQSGKAIPKFLSNMGVNIGKKNLIATSVVVTVLLTLPFFERFRQEKMESVGILWSNRREMEAQAIETGIIAPLVVLCGLVVPPGMSGLTLQCLMIGHLAGSSMMKSASPVDGGSAPQKAWMWMGALTTWYSLGHVMFFLTGHEFGFASLQLSSGFLFGDSFNFWLAGSLVAFNTFACECVCIMAVYTGALALCRHNDEPVFARGVGLWAVFAGVVTPRLVHALSCVVCVTLHREHLMLWAVFAPRAVFSAAFLLADVGLYLLLSAAVYGPWAETQAERKGDEDERKLKEFQRARKTIKELEREREGLRNQLQRARKITQELEREREGLRNQLLRSEVA